MKKLTALILALCLMLLCGCTAAPSAADLAAAKESGACGVWYADLFGRDTTLTLNEDLTCTMNIENDSLDYKGTWKVSGEVLTLKLNAAVLSGEIQMEEMPFAITADALVCTAEGGEFLVFRRELPSAVEIAPVRTDAAIEDFEGVWQAEIISLNGIILEVNGIIIPPAEFGADMTVSIGTTSAAVDTAAEPDTTYLFPISIENGTLTLTLDDMVMTAQLHEDGMMSISGVTPLHKTVFTEDAPLVLYMGLAQEDSE